eukprot:TRINITY_DN8367_c0_g2_i1.p1 TRINITY_DN8367_c0_g2~~TRINITY_DN8367_c0_g2_i1.p1  ORF type:complete len:253 (-),score=59.58 TRINITY_DN8367_c0_g2_i1:634-1392(-)
MHPMNSTTMWAPNPQPTRPPLRLGVSVGVDDEDAAGASPFVVPCADSDTVLALKNEILSRSLRMPTGVRITQVLSEKDQRPACWLIHKTLGELNDKDPVGEVCRDSDTLLAIFNQKDQIPVRAARVGKVPYNTTFIQHIQPPRPVSDPAAAYMNWAINQAPRKFMRQIVSVKMTQMILQERQSSPFKSPKDLQQRLKTLGARIGSSTLEKMRQIGFFEPYSPQSEAQMKQYQQGQQQQQSSGEEEDDDDDGM